MKKLYYLIFALFVANVTVYATPQNIWDENSWDDPNEYQEDDEIEIQSNIFSPCISGGPGSTSCSLDGDADGFGEMLSYMHRTHLRMLWCRVSLCRHIPYT